MNDSSSAGVSLGPLLAIAAVAIGLALVLVPMLPNNWPMEMDTNFAENSESHRRLLATASMVDGASKGGDLVLLKSLLSERYVSELSRGLTGEQDLDSVLSKQQIGLIGDLSSEEFILGSSGMGRAFMIYRIDRPDPALRAYVFYWDGQKFQLDARATRLKKTWTMPDAKAQASYWGLSFLRGR
jgi:hypothetical protein